MRVFSCLALGVLCIVRAFRFSCAETRHSAASLGGARLCRALVMTLGPLLVEVFGSRVRELPASRWFSLVSPPTASRYDVP